MIKIPASLHTFASGVILAMTLISLLAAVALTFTQQTVPVELWKLAGGSLFVYGGFKTVPVDDSDPTE